MAPARPGGTVLIETAGGVRPLSMHPLFALDRYSIGHVTSIEISDVLRIATDPRQWAHAVEFVPEALSPAANGPVVVDVTLAVESGQIEVGALSDTGTTFLSQSIVGTGSHVVRLSIASIERCRSIVVRNAAPAVSIVRIVAIAERPGDRSPTSIDGFDLSAPIGSSRRGFWDKNIFADVLDLAGAGARTVFHAGAFHGDETAVYLKLFPHARIHCFEPSPAAFGILQNRLAGIDRVALHQIGLSDRRGRIPFYLNRIDETNSSFPFAAGAGRFVDTAAQGPQTDVPSATIDELVGELGVGGLDVLNLDVQGAEVAVLRGAARLLERRLIKVIISELTWVAVYEGQCDPHAVLELLARAGYRLFDFYNFAYSDSGQLLWGDAVFIPDLPAHHRAAVTT